MTLWQYITLGLLALGAVGVAWLIYKACAVMADDLDQYNARPYQ